jgi:hypothetical protein
MEKLVSVHSLNTAIHPHSTNVHIHSQRPGEYEVGVGVGLLEGERQDTYRKSTNSSSDICRTALISDLVPCT